MEAKQVFHTIEPVYAADSKVLILGTMPSPKSREEGFYYAHPQNRFWRVLAGVFDEPTPMGTDARREFVLRHKIALWDVLASCNIEGAADSSIKNPVANDIKMLLAGTEIKAIFTTGQAAYKLYMRYCADKTGVAVTALPSTSAANARMSAEALVDKYSVIRDAMGGIEF